MKELLALTEPRGIHLVEDCAQAIGAAYSGKPVGAFGRLGCFSFYPTKNLGACGDGGMVVGDDEALAEKLRMLRAHGARTTGFHGYRIHGARRPVVQEHERDVRGG